MKPIASLLLLVIFASCVEAQSPSSPLWSDLDSGPHAIGFKTIRLYDYTRVVGPKYDPEGAPVKGERARPLLISVWYPAPKTATGRRMDFTAYLQATMTDASLGAPTEEQKRKGEEDLRAFYERPFNFPYGKMPDEGWRRLMTTGTRALAGAAGEPGSFPLLVGVGGALSHAVTNEYLASHGYIIALVTSPVAAPPGALGMESYARDIEFAIAHMRAFPGIDRMRLGVYGFSFAGMPALLCGMRNPDVDAVAALESAIFIERYTAMLKTSASYDPARLRAPMLHMFRRSESEKQENLDGLRALTHARRYRYLLDPAPLFHQDFSTHGIGVTNVIGLRGEDAATARRAFEMTNRYLRAFFDAYVKREAQAQAFLDRQPEENGAPKGLLTIERLNAEPVVKKE